MDGKAADQKTVSLLNVTERVYKGVTISTVTGDITRLEVDAIVNPANSLMIMGGGVAGAILRAGGREIQDEALKQAPVPVGKAIATKAGKLKTKHVIHAPTMERPAMQIGKQNVELAAKGALECAKQLGVGSLAFPGMGTGVGGFDVDEAAKIMVRELVKHIDESTSLKHIILVGFSEDLTQAFRKALKAYATP